MGGGGRGGGGRGGGGRGGEGTGELARAVSMDRPNAGVAGELATPLPIERPATERSGVFSGSRAPPRALASVTEGNDAVGTRCATHSPAAVRGEERECE